MKIEQFEEIRRVLSCAQKIRSDIRLHKLDSIFVSDELCWEFALIYKDRQFSWPYPQEDIVSWALNLGKQLDSYDQGLTVHRFMIKFD